MIPALEVGVAVGLTVGMVLARRGHEVAHRRTQVFAVTLAAILALFAMALPYWAGVSIAGAGSPQPRHQSVAVVHTVLGSLAVLFGAIVVLRAAGVAPPLPSRHFVIYMRAAYALFIAAILLGFAARLA